MSSATNRRTGQLSVLLDDVVGTEEIVHMRQDYCKIYDCLQSAKPGLFNVYYTGSRAEGLHLPGSDQDFMYDINIKYNIQVVQTVEDVQAAVCRNVFVMSSNDSPSCFTLLRSVRPIQNNELLNACQYFDNCLHLSSYIFVDNYTEQLNEKYPTRTTARQGPSIEEWSIYGNKSQSGNDRVLSIHCSFWPDSASEWRTRQRKYGWPFQNDIKSIVDFGFHLVPVGHPKSKTNLIEWRISFSVAERELVWSFTHVQMQCYAVLKIILKEFINVYCTPSNRILCSYFIKTFLFWTFEETNSSFWCKENIWDCLVFLLSGFRNCVAHGVLRHYFIREFNLLSVKLTHQVQRELLKVYDIILQSDIRIFNECKTLKNVWAKFVNLDARKSNAALTIQRPLCNDNNIFMDFVRMLQYNTLQIEKTNLLKVLVRLLKHCLHSFHKTHLLSFVIRVILFRSNVLSIHNPMLKFSNRELYKACRFLMMNTHGFDMSTCRLWFAMLATKRCDYCLSLLSVFKVLSSISRFTLYFNGVRPCHVIDDSKSRYIDMFSKDSLVTERARKAWMFDLQIMPRDSDMVPAAIQMELLHCDECVGVHVSPFICAYYIMFLNYHELRHYEDRDRALRQIIGVINTPQHRGFMEFYSMNIAGHCLLLVGNYALARLMFVRSYQLTSPDMRVHRLNSAAYYLQHLC